jgi:predicted transcriptional regulator
MSGPSTRVNLSVPLDVAIQIEKDCDKRGISRAQFIKESIYEKLKRSDTTEEISEIKHISDDVLEIKRIMMILLELYNKK